MSDIKFYTWDIDIYYPYALVPFHKFFPKMIQKYKRIIIDCGVDKWLNTKKKEYPYLDQFEEKVLKYGSKKVKFVIPDYPTDIIKDKDERVKWVDTFLERTHRNIERFHNLFNTILSVQYKFEDFDNFKNSWEKYYQLSKFMAIGNLCKSKNKHFFLKVLKFISENNSESKPIHIFGIGIPLFKVLCNFLKFNQIKFEISFDTTKWSFTDNPDLRKKVNGFMCKYPYRQEFLDDYLKKLDLIQESIKNKTTLMDFKGI